MFICIIIFLRIVVKCTIKWVQSVTEPGTIRQMIKVKQYSWSTSIENLQSDNLLLESLFIGISLEEHDLFV